MRENTERAASATRLWQSLKIAGSRLWAVFYLWPLSNIANLRNYIGIYSFTGIYWSKASNRHKCQCIERLKQCLCDTAMVTLLCETKNIMWKMVNNLTAIQNLNDMLFSHCRIFGCKHVRNRQACNSAHCFVWKKSQFWFSLQKNIELSRK